MAHPRRVLPADTYVITRRCYQRTFRLRPSAATNEIFAYCLALAMRKTGVLLHAVCVMSNHHHLVVTDPLGLLPDFLRELHRLTAKAINASQGQRENLWAAEACNVVRLVTDADVADKIAYVAANPVAAGLVARPNEWPGMLAWGRRAASISRPASYFAEDGTCPAELVLVLDHPPTREPDDGLQPPWAERVRRLVEEKVAEARDAMRTQGRRFLGRAAILSASFARRARSCEESRRRIPTFAARLASVREALRKVERVFRTAYRSALERWRGGDRTAHFPPGTWWMGVFHRADVAASTAGGTGGIG